MEVSMVKQNETKKVKKVDKKVRALDGRKVEPEVAAVALQEKIADVRQVLEAKIADQTLSGIFREFKTENKGWYLGGKILVDGVRCQVSCNIIIIGSKPAKKSTK